MSAEYIEISCKIDNKAIAKMLVEVFNFIEDDDDAEVQEPDERINQFLATPMDLSVIFENDECDWEVEECRYKGGKFNLDVMGGYLAGDDDDFCETVIKMLNALGAKKIKANYENSQVGGITQIRLKKGKRGF